MDDLIEKSSRISLENLKDINLLLAANARRLGAYQDLTAYAQDEQGIHFVLKNTIGEVEKRMNVSAGTFELEEGEVVATIRTITQVKHKHMSQ